MPGMPEFFRGLTARASARGWLRLWLMRLDGRPVASEFQLEADGRVHASQGERHIALLLAHARARGVVRALE